MSDERTEEQRGTIFGLGAYLLWGVFPLFFPQLLPAGPWEILAHRIVWTLVVCLIALSVMRDWRFVSELVRRPARLAIVTVAAFTIAINWLVYVYAVNSGHTSDASLGYFLNPLVTIALGVVVLREQLRPLQWVAVGVGAVACVYLAIAGGSFPWIALALAVSFATYGLVKKRIGSSLTAFQSLASETMILSPFALAALAVLGAQGQTTFGSHGAGHAAWLASSGIATAIPLLLFAAAASRVPLVTIGLLQFITPVLQLLCGVLALGEHVSTARWLGFAIVWVALIVLTADTLHATMRGRRLARAARGAAE